MLVDGLLLGWPGGGVEASVEQLARELLRLAPDLVRVAATPRAAQLDPPPPADKLVMAPRYSACRPGRVLAQHTWLARAARGFSLLHGAAYVLPAPYRGPGVATVYDLIALRHPEWVRLGNALHYRWALPRTLANAQAIIAPSRVVADEVLSFGARRVEVVPLGVRDIFFRSPPGEVPAALAGKPFFLVVGNIEPKKNLAAVVEAYEAVAGEVDELLAIAGRPGWKCGPVLRRIRSSPAASRIVLLGRVPDGALAALYRSCTALVQYSLYEGFGLVPLEAMACGAAVIASDGGALPEVCGPAAHIVPLGDTGQLAEALKWLSHDEDARRQLGERGWRHAAQFTWRRHAAAVLQIYGELL